MLTRPTKFLIFLSLLLSAVIFGFLYAWVCSTMWGLDRADPRVTIAAMQAMNASVRNAVFAPAFFGTPFALLVTAVLLWRQRYTKAGALFAISSAVYFGLGLVLTMAINVPMNEALGALDVPQDIAHARDVWLAYASDWQFWNQLCTLSTSVSFLLLVAGLMALAQRPTL